MNEARSPTHAAPDGAVEALLSDIAFVAYCAEQRMRNTSLDPEVFEYELDLMREAVKRMGWMADIALKRLGSSMALLDGDAKAWFLSPKTNELLAIEVQS